MGLFPEASGGRNSSGDTLTPDQVWSAGPGEGERVSCSGSWLGHFVMAAPGSSRGLGPGCVHMLCYVASVVSDSVTPRTVAHQAPLSMGFCRQECESKLSFPSAIHMYSIPFSS
ncbi:unnamed protein product [Rangifer tarandus platyrhynchus]|uniref:Uncharacterized protein n=3 Tax=Rangifer tarandus platyrhynchus TaxID=3082113 RepID=A0ACB1KHN3_RANTA|nr:unnamed protein product [Rangifer tarandus platyrhynchus]